MAAATYPFIQARNYTPGRTDAIDVIVIHAMEAPDKPDTAENVARWFAGPSAPRASAHYCIDADSIVQCVRDGDVAWHAPGCNHDGLGFEHAGYSSQTPADWSDAYNTTMLERSASLAAEKCREYRIPAEWLSVADLQAGRRGLTSHNNVSLAFRRSDHTDPGPGFPVERYLALVGQRLGAAPPVEPLPAKPAPPTLARGDSGPQVKRLQGLLRARGLDPGPVDGIFGPLTEAAVRRFQRSRRLQVDGIAGPQTWQALKSGR